MKCTWAAADSVCRRNAGRNLSLGPARFGDTDAVTPTDINDPGYPENKHRTRESQRQLRELLMTWDLIGVAGVAEAADEYDCMLSPLLHQLHEGLSVDEIRDWLVAEVEGHFGARADPVRERQLAVRVSAWWRRRATESPSG
jgi:hypothetical protein